MATGLFPYMADSQEDVILQGDGVPLHAVAAGPKDGPLVVLLHGFPEFWYGWRKQICPLATAGYRVLAIDQRGYNTSGKPGGIAAYRLDRTAADILSATGKQKFAVIGHDWGGAVAWWLATFHPSRLTRVAILNVPHPLVMKKHLRSDLAQLRRSWYMFALQIPWLPEALMRSQNYKALADSLRTTSRPGTFQPEDIERYREAWSQPGALTAMVNWYRALIRSASREIPTPIQIPLLLLWGANDPFCRRELANESAQLCSNAELHFEENSTHWVQHEEPAWVNDHLLRFLDSL